MVSSFSPPPAVRFREMLAVLQMDPKFLRNQVGARRMLEFSLGCVAVPVFISCNESAPGYV